MWSFNDIITFLSPGWARSRAQARQDLRRLAMEERALEAMDAAFGGGASYTGASNKQSLALWGVSSGDADSDYLDEAPLIRDRSQELFRNTPAGRGVIKRLATGTVGSGLVMRSTIDRNLLNMSMAEAKAWEATAEREFRLWADSRECDFSRRLTFNEIQFLAYMSQKVRGDCFILMPLIPRPGVLYDLRLQLLEADRVSNPDYQEDTDEIAGGIRRNAAGVPIAICVQSIHPGNYITAKRPEWKEIPIFGKETGRRNVLHLMESERIDQSRGEPILAPVIDTLKQLSRYSEAELSAAVINAFLTVFIKRSYPPNGSADAIDYGNKVDYLEEQREKWMGSRKQLGSGTLIEGAPGEDIQTIVANRPNAQFDGFFTSCLKQIGMAIGVPFEVLIQHFQSSYSASRAALLEYHKAMQVSRNWLRSNLCQAVYEEFLTEAVLKGRLIAPGFLHDPVIRAAYSQSEWMGPSAGQIDPVKEVEAARLRVAYGFSTQGRETAELTGMDYEQVAATRAEELDTWHAAGLPPIADKGQGYPQPPPETEEDAENDA